MLIQTIRIQNFRRIQGTVTFHPSCSPEKNVTLLRGNDWRSVDALYEACLWCIQGQKALGRGDLLLDDALADDLPDGDSECVQVEMTLSHDGVEYRVLRSLVYTRRGNVISSDGPSVEHVSCRGADGRRQTLSNAAVSQFLADLEKDPSIRFVRDCRSPDDLPRHASQILLFAERGDVDKWIDVLYERGGKVYQIRSSTRYAVIPAWEDAALPGEVGPRGDLPRFSLPGRAKLEDFFNDHVVDILRDEERYRSLGVGFPGAFILHGLPGCGKTYAVEQLGEFLRWPRYDIDSGSVGSTYSHGTGIKIDRIFEQAKENAPAILVIDEMDAFLSSRARTHDDGQHAEEVAEFLRHIPEAAQNHVLVIGLTNRLSDIDPAFLRRGRFDHILRVEMPSEEETRSALAHLLSALPTAEDVDLPPLAAALAGRPMSDLAFVVREAGRLSARAGKDAIDQSALWRAVSLPPPNAAPRPIGFIA